MDETEPYLRVSVRYIVCFQCYGRDRVRHLAMYVWLAREFMKERGLVDLCAILLASLWPMLLLLDERIEIDRNALATTGDVTASAQLTLHGLFKMGFVHHWGTPVISVVYKHSAHCDAALVVSDAGSKRSLYIHYYKDAVWSRGILLSMPPKTVSFKWISGTVFHYPADRVVTYPFDVTTGPRAHSYK